MYLNDEEKRILDGEAGYIAQKCMKFLVDYGEAAGAERLVDIDGTADIHPGNNPCWIADYAITPEEIEECAKRGERPTGVPSKRWRICRQRKWKRYETIRRKQQQ